MPGFEGPEHGRPPRGDQIGAQGLGQFGVVLDLGRQPGHDLTGAIRQPGDHALHVGKFGFQARPLRIEQTQQVGAALRVGALRDLRDVLCVLP